ncbi:MAG: hypothetical protein K0041_06780 [Acidithiobacillus sp.]|nr:hypothetical protein [Acidithiobacillus sp.]
MADVQTGTAEPNTNTANATLPSNATPPDNRPAFQYKPDNQQQPASETVAKAELERMKAEYESRMAALAEEAKKAKELQAQLDAIEKQKLEEQGKFKELYEKERTEREKEIRAMRRELARADLKALAIREGIIDPDIINLIPSKDFKWNEETGRFDNLEELLVAHKQAKPNLYKTAEPTGQQPQQPVQNRATTGDPQVPPTTPPGPGKDVSTMGRAEYEAAKASYLRSLRSYR